MILGEGLEKRYARHVAIAKAMRSALNKIDLRIVAEERGRADTMTAAYYPSGIDDEAFRSNMVRHGVVVAGGLGQLRGKIFRVGHMGNASPNDLIATIGAIEASLSQLDYSFPIGGGVGAAIESLKKSYPGS